MAARISYNPNTSHLELSFPYDPTGRAQSLAKGIYGYRWVKARKVWEYPATIETARSIVDAFDPDAGEGFSEWWQRVTVQRRAAERANALLQGEAEAEGDFGFAFHTEPYAHQRDYCRWAAMRDMAGLTYRGFFSEQGTGKTKSEIDMTTWEIQRGYCKGMPLVFCPNSVKRNWITEINIHAPPNLFVPVLVAGSAQEKVQTLERTSEIARTGSIPFVVINYDVLSQPSQEPVLKILKSMFKQGVFGKVIFDEATMIKNTKSSRGAEAFKLSRHLDSTGVIVSMTGTPYPKRLTDIFNLMRVLSPEILGASWPSFYRHHAVFGGWNNKEVVGYQNEDELRDKVNRHSFRRLLAECTDLPDEVHVTRTCEMSKEQQRVTAEIRKREMAMLEEGGEALVITSANAMAKILRFNQITSGFLEDKERGRSMEFSPNPKLQLLEQYLAEEVPADDKVVVWCAYQEDVKRIRDRLEKRGRALGGRPVTFYGPDSEAAREDAERAFKEDSDVRFMIATPDAGGWGLNWQVACHCVFYSYGFKWEALEQARSRIRRITQRSKMTYVWLVAENPTTKQASHGVSSGINQYILENLGSTESMAKKMTGDDQRIEKVLQKDPKRALRQALEVV